MLNERNMSFEFLRLLAIFGVVLLHVPYDKNTDFFDVELIRLSFRWCVPFFFMLSGYFLSSCNGLPDITSHKLKRLLVIIFSANALFFPFLVYTKHFGFLTKELFISGTWFHLWFLNSMLIFYLFIIPFSGLFLSRFFISIIAVVIVVFFYFIDLMGSVDESGYYSYLGLIRQFQSIPFMWFGFLLSQCKIPTRKYSLLVAAFLIVFGLFSSFLEVNVLRSHLISIENRTLLIGGILICFGLIILGRCVTFKGIRAKWIGGISKHVLIIYVFHPLFISFSFYIISKFIHGGALSLLMSTILICSFSLFLSFILSIFLPSFHSLFKGDVTFFSKGKIKE